MRRLQDEEMAGRIVFDTYIPEVYGRGAVIGSGESVFAADSRADADETVGQFLGVLVRRPTLAVDG